MKLLGLIKVSIAVFAVLAGMNIFFPMLTARANDERARAYGIRKVFIQAGHQLRTASLELTRMARAYIVMGMEPQLELYWKELLVDDRLGTVRRMFVDSEASPYEMELLDRALAYQRKLRAIDAMAIEARTTGQYQLALYITYSSTYMAYGAYFVNMVNELNDATFARTQKMVERAERSALVFETLTFAATVLFGIMIVLGTILILREVKATMRREREANELNRMYLDACPMFIEIWDDEKNMIGCNEKVCEFFGLTDKKEFIGRYGEFSPECQPCGTRSVEKSAAMVAKALEEGYVRFEWMYVKSNRELMPVDANFVRLRRNGKDIVVGYNYDLRPVKAAETLTRKLLDNSPMLMEFWDLDGHMLDCNQKMLDVFGVSKGEFTKRFYEFSAAYQPCGTPAREKNDEMIKCAMAGAGGLHRAEWMFVLPNGEELPTETTWAHIVHQGESMIIVYNQDLRPVKAAIKKEQRAEEENLAKTRFLAHMSHEIRTPMNAILGIADIQLQKEDHPPETEDAFFRIHNSSSLLLNIVNDILDLSRVVAGKMEIIPAIYDLASLIVDTVQLNHMHIGGKDIDFRISVDERLPVYLIGDELRIKQVLNNLLSNAIKYTLKGTVSLSLGLESGRGPDCVTLVIGVSDTGQGMTKEQIDDLFEEYSRFNLQNNRDVEGSGLGMTIAYSLIKLMQGDITVESEPWSGSTFTVRLPQKPHGGDVLGGEAASNLQNMESTRMLLKRKPRRNREPMPYGRVLVVDDVDINLYVVEGILAPYEIAVETATSGHEAIAKIKSGKVYDIIFMDHMMPGMDGVEATKIIRGMGYEQPIVALTANALKDTEKMFMENGFSGFVSKPIDIDKLDTYLMGYIRDKHSAEKPLA